MKRHHLQSNKLSAQAAANTNQKFTAYKSKSECKRVVTDVCYLNYTEQNTCCTYSPKKALACQALKILKIRVLLRSLTDVLITPPRQSRCFINSSSKSAPDTDDKETFAGQLIIEARHKEEKTLEEEAKRREITKQQRCLWLDSKSNSKAKFHFKVKKQ